MSTIGIIDADQLGRKKHRFPNLCCMKISAYHKNRGDTVELLLDYNRLQEYDHVYIAKVFTDTDVPKEVLELPNVTCGGTGFFFDKAEGLPHDIEHSFPDYRLYDEWIELMVSTGKNKSEFKWYTDFSIGYMTRGCFRKCKFCVNQRYDRAFIGSTLGEFLDTSRKYVCLLDDNFLSHPKWEQMLQELNNCGHKFHFKQGLDERLLTEHMCQELSRSNLTRDLIFAFDSITDSELIQSKLKLLRKSFTDKVMKFYVLCGFDRHDKYDQEFFSRDILETFERIKILMNYNCLPYIMRYQRYSDSPFRGTYVNLARWCNQPGIFKKKSYEEFLEINDEASACRRYSKELLKIVPEVNKYYHMKFGENKCSTCNEKGGGVFL